MNSVSGDNFERVIVRRWVSKPSGLVAAGVAVAAAVTFSGSAIAQPQDEFIVVVGDSGEERVEGLEITSHGSVGTDSVEIQLLGLQRVLDDIRNRRRGDRARRRARQQEEEQARIRSYGTPIDLSALQAQNGGAPGSAPDHQIGYQFSRLNVFGDVFTSSGDHDGTALTPKHDTEALGINFGADYRIGQNLVIGGVVGAIERQTNFSGSNSETTLDGVNIAALASWYITDVWYVDGIVRGGWNDYESSRQTGARALAIGETDGNDYAASVASGYEFYRGPLTVGPRVRVNYIDASIDGFREQGGAGALAYDDQDIESLTTNLGVEATYAMNASWGVLLPQIDVEWVHEFEDDEREVRAQSVTGGPIFVVPVDEPDSDFARVGLGATAVLTGGAIFFVRADLEVEREDLDEQIITIGTRLEF